MIARAAEKANCRSVAFTYNDPIIFLEYAVDVARACHERDIRTVAVTSGWINEKPREVFFDHMDAANVDLKAFTDRFYRKLCGATLQPVLDTLEYLKQHTDVWFEITTLLIPGENDSDRELNQLTTWIVERLGPDVPLHFSAFHPDWKFRDRSSTPPRTLTRAREIAMKNGVRFAFTGNVHDPAGAATYCHRCGALLIGRDWYQLTEWNLTADGHCSKCGEPCAGRFDSSPGSWGARAMPIRISDFE
jgi:pyruvate formate lyase activating enzyme